MKIKSVTVGCQLEASMPVRKFAFRDDTLELGPMGDVVVYNSKPVCIIAESTGVQEGRRVHYIHGTVAGGDTDEWEQPFYIDNIVTSVPSYNVLVSHSILGDGFQTNANRDTLILAGSKPELRDEGVVSIHLDGGSPIHNIPSSMTASIRRAYAQIADADLDPSHITPMRRPHHDLGVLSYWKGTLNEVVTRLGGCAYITHSLFEHETRQGPCNGDWYTPLGELVSRAASMICAVMQYRNMTDIEATQDIKTNRSYLRVLRARSIVGNFKGDAKTVLYRMLRQPLRTLRCEEFDGVKLVYDMQLDGISYITAIKDNARHTFAIPSWVYSQWCPMAVSRDDAWSLGADLLESARLNHIAATLPTTR